MCIVWQPTQETAGVIVFLCNCYVFGRGVWSLCWFGFQYDFSKAAAKKSLSSLICTLPERDIEIKLLPFVRGILPDLLVCAFRNFYDIPELCLSLH